jgi:hypothetical protein
MTPTPKLRFVEREAGFEQYDVKVTERHGTEVCYRQKKIRILQQWWQVASTGQITTNGEWRDVLLENEA